MADSFYLGAYWGPRAESVGSCAERLADCIGRLGAAHPVLSAWHRKGRSVSAASAQPIDTGRDALEVLLSEGRDRTDIGGEVIEELGFHAALWNRGAAVSLRTLCGAVPAAPFVSNSCVLGPFSPSDTAAVLFEPAVARGILMALVEAWDPQWAAFTSNAMRESQHPSPGRPVAGWLTYVAGDKDLHSPPPGVIVEKVAEGTLITAASDPRQVSGPQIAAVAHCLAT
ncbi:Imm52 family immunity protein [Dactylosporangium sp. CA-152071]|uniref:Imm52 family immunity protein n=1 Tax=Dactylosporangium sp. CA-152071 TaxID=3239933 RepID=UPI003D8EF8C8